MGAKEMFSKLGYKQDIYDYKDGFILPGIKYSKEIVIVCGENEKMKNCVNPVKYIEFYTSSKDIMIGMDGKFGDKESTSKSVMLNADELKAIHAQIFELGW